MTQDRASGIAGNEFGRRTAPLIAERLGAKMLRSAANEATYKGQRVVIKCARPRTTSVGVTYLMLDRLDSVIAAFQQDDGTFQIYALDARAYRQEMRGTRSRGASAGKVGLVSRLVFERMGCAVGSVFLVRACCPTTQ